MGSCKRVLSVCHLQQIRGGGEGTAPVPEVCIVGNVLPERRIRMPDVSATSTPTLVGGRNSIPYGRSVAVVLVWRTGTEEGLAGAGSMDVCESESGCLGAHARTFAVGSASQLAPDFAQAAQQYR